MRRFRPTYGLFLILFTLVLVWRPASAVERHQADTPAPSKAASNALLDAWEQARAAGSYAFSARLTQRAIPVARVRNVGRTEETGFVYLEGASRLDDGELDLTLWSGSDHYEHPERGAEIQVTGTGARARIGGGAWQEIDDLSAGLAPEGDFLAFVGAATNVRALGQESRAGISFSRYSFDVDGPTYARTVREQLRKTLEARGELPPGTDVGLPANYAGMHAFGEVWVTDDGLPLREIITLRFPPGPEVREEAEITVDFRDFGQTVAAAGATGEAPPATTPVATLADATGTAGATLLAGARVALPQLLAVGLLLAALALLLAFRRERWLHVGFNFLFVLVLVLSPLLQSVVSARDARQARPEAEAPSAEQPPLPVPDTEIVRSRGDLLAALQGDDGTDRDGDTVSDVEETILGTNPLSADSDLDGTWDSLEPTLRNRRPADDNGDDDGDGLTNYEESILGTSSSTADDDEDGIFDGADSDADGIDDPLEVNGFSYQGQIWYLNALEADSNGDQIIDTLECFVDSGGALDCPDTDGDGTPDAWDPDNDGDGVNDGLDTSPFQASAGTFTGDDRFSYVVDGLTTGTIVYAEFQLRPSNPDRLWYAYNVLDWPTDKEGQMQDEDDTTFYDDCLATLKEGCELTDANGDVKLIPMLEIEIPAGSDTLPDADTLDQYGILVQDVDNAGNQVAYVPVAHTTDPLGDAHQAFAGKMIYQPNADSWGGAHSVRLAWVVQALVDNVCIDYDDFIDECMEYADNEVQILHTYYDEWALTGFAVHEDYGVDLSIIYEDPDEDDDLHDDANLYYLSSGLDQTFVTARDCDATTVEGACLSDGQRDVPIGEIAARFDHDSNDSVSPTDRWGLPDIFSVREYSYDHIDEALMTTAITETSAILTAEFSSHWSAANPISPTLMIAREERFRASNLDVAGLDSSVSWSGSQLTVDMNGGDPLPVQTAAGLSWAPFYYDDTTGSWEGYDITAYGEMLRARLEAVPLETGTSRSRLGTTLDTEISDRDERGYILATILYYYTVYEGLYNIVAIAQMLLWPTVMPVETPIPSAGAVRSDSELEGAKYADAGAALAVKLTRDYLLYNVRYQPFIDYLGSLDEVLDAAASNPRQAMQIASVSDIGAKDTINNLRGIWADAWGRGTGSRGMGIAKLGVIALGLVGATLFAGGLLADNNALATAGAIALGLASFVILAVAPILNIKTAVQGLKATTSLTAGTRLKSVLGGSATLLGNPVKANVLGLVLDVGITWILFGIQVATAENLTNIEFNSLLAGAIAATILAVLFFALSFSVIGFLIVTITAVIDLILSLLCAADVDTDPLDVTEEGDCFTITGAVTEFLAGLLYSFDSTVEYESELVPLVQFKNLEYELSDPDAGFQAGNQITFIATIDTNAYHKQPTDSGAFSTAYYSQSKLKDTTLNYNFGSTDNPPSASLGDNDDQWTLSGLWYEMEYTIVTLFGPVNGTLDQFYALRLNQELRDSPRTLVAGLNQQWPLYLNTSYALPGYDCWLGVCSSETLDEEDADPSDLSETFTFDIYPATLDEFYTWEWDDALEAQADHDGDGLLSSSAGGNDPDDSATACEGGLCWDSDGDGLSDLYEMEEMEAGPANGGSLSDPKAEFSDGDGLNDYEEAFWNTNPAEEDSDGDGLNDDVEVHGWAFTYGPNKTTWVTSDPNNPDSDGDGLGDLLEKNLHETDPVTFPYNPRVFNPNPLALYGEFDDVDGIVAPGTTVAYTATVRNEFDLALTASGALTVTDPAVLGGGSSSQPFALFQGQETSIVRAYSVPNSAGSQTATVVNSAAATLQETQVQDAPSLGTVSNSKQFDLVIDDDVPTATVDTPLFVMSGGVRVLGGAAADPTSYVEFVEVRVGNGPWQPATGAEAWSFAWSVPTGGGSYTLHVRATDIVGNVGTPTSYTITVDDTAPTATFDASFNGNPFVAARRNAAGKWAIDLAGSATDNAAGVRRVEIRLEPNGNDWQEATFDDSSGDWSLAYELSAFDGTKAAIVDATDQYTASVRATDLALDAGNVSTTTLLLRVDNTPPSVALDPLIAQDNLTTTVTVDQRPLTTTRLLTGIVTDTGPIGAGVAGLEIAFTPYEVVQDLTATALYYPLDEPPQATSFEDHSGNNNDGTCLAILNGDRCPDSGAPGRFGWAASFDNSTSFEEEYIEISTLDVNESDYSAVLWFNTTCADCGLFSADRFDLASGGSDRELFLSGGNVCAMVLNSGTPETICSGGLADYDDGQWHMAAQVLGAGGHKLYVDGELAAEGPATASSFTDQEGLNVGFAPAAVTDFFAGRIDELRVVNQALDAATVRGLYQSWTSFLPASPGAVTSTWAYTIPKDVEGLYQIDLSATDMLGNRNDDPGSWRKWRGEIDTRAPQVAITVTYSGASAATAQTHYEGVAADANLTETSFSFPCDLNAGDRRYDPADPGQLVEIASSCSVDGWQKEPVFLRACDAFDHCAAAYPDFYYVYSVVSPDTNPYDGGTISRIPMSGESTQQEDVQVLLADLARPHGLALDVEAGHMYWAQFGADASSGAIYRANLDGTDPVAVISGLPSPEPNVYTTLTHRPWERFGLALDADANKLYWTQSADGQVWRANLDGTGRELLYDGNTRLYWITLDTVNNKVYWLKGRGLLPYEIWWANLDGTAAARIHPPTDSNASMGGIAVDPAAGEIYWTEIWPESDLDTRRSALWRADLDGANPATVLVDIDNAGPVHINEFDDKVAWLADPFSFVDPTGFFYLTYPHFRQVNPDGSGEERLFPSYYIYPVTQCDPVCSEYTAAIEPAGSDFAIARIPGYTVESTDLGVTMETVGSDLALVGEQLTYTFRVDNYGPLDALDTVLAYTLPPNTSVATFPGCSDDGVTATCALGTLAAFDAMTLTAVLDVNAGATGRLESAATVTSSVSDHLATNDSTEATAYFAPPRPTAGQYEEALLYYLDDKFSSDPVVESFEAWNPFDPPATVDPAATGVGGLAVDVDRGQLYGTDTTAGTLWASDLDGSNRVTLLSGLSNPRALIINRNEGALYWSESGGIHRYYLDSQVFEALLPFTGGESQPLALALDPIRQRLFWYASGSIYYRDYVTGGPAVLVADNAGSSFGLAVDSYRGLLYWPEYNYYGRIWQIGMDGSGRSVLADDIRTPTQLWYEERSDTLYFFWYSECGFQYNYRLGYLGIGSSSPSTLECYYDNPEILTGDVLDVLPAPPAITSAPVTTTVALEAYSYQAWASGAYPLSWALPTAPAGMSISSFGQVTWTPDQVGDFAVEVEVSNAGGSDTQAYTVTVTAPAPPQITSAPGTRAELNQPYNYAPFASGVGDLTWSLTTAPAGMAIDPASGAISWTPTITGVFTVELGVMNQFGGANSQQYDLTVYEFDGANQLYWTAEFPAKEIQRADLSQADPLPVQTFAAATQLNLGRLAVDRLANQVYWTENGNTGDGAIYRASLDGTGQITVTAGLTSPRGLAVDPFNNALYWSDGSSIWRADLDGSNAAEIVTGLLEPDVLQLDLAYGRLYWLSGDPNADNARQIMSAGVDGNDLTSLRAGMNDSFGLVLDGSNRWLIWSEFRTIYWAGIATDGSTLNNVNTAQSAPATILGLGYDPERAWPIAWTDSDDNIYEGNLSQNRGALNLDNPGFALGDVDTIYPYYYDLPWPETRVITPTDGTTLQSFEPVTLTGVITAPASIKDVVVSQFIGGSYTDIFSRTWGEGEATTATWETLWLSPTLGTAALGTHQFRVFVRDWGDRPAQELFAVTLALPRSNYTLPPGFADPYAAIINPPSQTVLTSFDPVTITGNAAASGWVNQVGLMVGDQDLDVFSWPVGTYTETVWSTVWAPPLVPNPATYTITVDVSDWLGGVNTYTYVYHVDVPPGPEDEPPGYDGPPLDAAILSPDDGTLLTSTAPIDLNGAAFAGDGLQQLTITVDGATFFQDNWADGQATESTFAVPWTPPGDGTYRLDAQVSDWAGRVQTDTHPVTVTVLATPPAIAIDPTVLTTSHQLSPLSVLLAGTLSAAPDSSTQVQIDGGTPRIVPNDGSTWNVPWLTTDDGVAHTVVASVTDLAGRTATDTQQVIVDVVPPSRPQLSLAYREGGGTQPLASGDTVYQAAPTLVLTWTAATDGSGVAGYLAGWTVDEAPDPAALTGYGAAARLHEQIVGDRQRLYAHVGAVDLYGNITWETEGPVIVDAPTTPDLIQELGYAGWQGSGATQLAADRELDRHVPAHASPGGVQRFFATWDATSLRLSWQGADWDSEGDLFIYLDSAPGGATTLYNPYGTGPEIGLPADHGAQMAADTLIRVHDALSVTLLSWTGSGWQTDQVISTANYRLEPEQFDLLLPFADLGLTPATPVRLLAVASRENQLRLWAAAPDHNPLNDRRVVSPLARGRVLGDYDLTQSFSWSGFGDGLLPNDGQFADSDLRLELRVSPAAAAVGFLESDLLDLLAPGGRLDADLDGVIDFPLPLDGAPVTVGDGQTLTYTLVYTNEGPATAPAVALDVDGFGALRFGGAPSTVVNIGDVAPGSGGQVDVQGTIDAALDGDAAELAAVLRDGPHGDYEWFWVQHDVDSVAPTGLALTSTVRYARPLTQSIGGPVQDSSPVATIILEVTAFPGGAVTIVECPDGNADGLWSCLWNPGSAAVLAGLDSFSIRAKAVDVHGNESAWSAPLTLLVDTTPPTVSLAETVEAGLATGFFNPYRLPLVGGVADDQEARAVRVCFTGSEDASCLRVGATPGDAPAGDWRYQRPPGIAADGITETLRITGIDGAGNWSLPLTRTYRLDTIAPVLTVTTYLSATGSGRAPDATVLAGTGSDGGQVDRVVIRIRHADGRVTWQEASLDGDSWAFEPETGLAGTVLLNVEAYDMAGNVTSVGPYSLVAGAYTTFIPLVQTGWLRFVYLPVAASQDNPIRTPPPYSFLSETPYR